MVSNRRLCSPLVTVLLLILPPITILGDATLRRLSDAGVPLVARALFDSSVHVILGCISWIAVTLHRGNDSGFRIEILLAAFFSAAVDLDHFIAARSLALKDALHMVSPPPFHDISLSFVIFVLSEVCFLVNCGRRWNARYHMLQLSTMLAVHLFRDAARRGLHVAYLFTIPPGEPYGLFPFFMPFFPLMARCVLALADVSAAVREYDGRDSLRSPRSSRSSPLLRSSSETEIGYPEDNYEAMFY